MGGFVLSNGIPTIATLTPAAEYATAAVVGSGVLNRACGLNHGFESYDDRIAAHPIAKLAGFYSKRPASVVTDHAIGWLERHYKTRFFLWVHYYDPHAPYDPPQPFRRLYPMDPYSGEIAYMDQEVGRLLDWIGQHGLDPRTLVVVIADHGEGLGEHGEKYHGIFLYDSTLHVPLIMAGPGVPRGKVIQQQVRSIDLMPTVMAYLHLSSGPEVQGVSLWPLMLHQRPVTTNYGYCETLYPRIFMGWSELRAMRTPEWKLILAPHPELYNLAADPEETSNLIARHPAEAQDLRSQIWNVVGGPGKDSRVTPLPLSAEERAQLESLAYVSAAPQQVELGTKAPDPKDYIDVLNMVEGAEGLLDKGAYAPAASLMEKALRRDPGNPAAHLYLATALELAGNDRRAIEVYKHAIKMGMENDEIYSRLGKVSLRLNQLSDASKAMARAAELNPTDLDNTCRLGTVYLQLGRPDDAAKAFHAVIAQSDRFASAYNGLGLVAVTHGDVEGARQDFEKAIEIDPDQAEPLLNLGLLYQKTGNNQEAIRYYERFLEKAPRGEYAQQIAGVREALRDLRSGRGQRQ